MADATIRRPDSIGTHDAGARSPSCARLALRFDADRLRADVRAIVGEAKPPVFGPTSGSGWSEVVLRAPGGDARLFAGSHEPSDYAPTAVLARCAYLQQVLTQLECPILSARVCVLSPSGLAREDTPRPTEGGRAELRIAIESGADVRVQVGRARADMEPGEVWWFAASEPVRVEGHDHVELVVDCLESAWLRSALAEAVPAQDDREARPAESPSSLAAILRASLTRAAGVAALARTESFEELVTALAGERRGELAAELVRARPAGLDLALDEWPEGEGWVPAEVEWIGDEPSFRLVWLQPEGLGAAPFFEEAVRTARRTPLNRHVWPRVSLGAIERHLAARAALPLVGMIAHVSRCGSTLVSRMLGASASLVVVSEPPPLDVVLREGPRDVPASVRIRALRATVGALGRRRTGRETGLVVKLDPWHVAWMDRLRDAFPSTPTVLVYREPATVLASQMRTPGRQMVTGWLGAPFDDVPTGLPALEHRARGVGLRVEHASRVQDAMLVSYAELPAAVGTRIAGHFGVTLGGDELRAMDQASRQDAKSPTSPFVPGARVEHEGEPTLSAAAERWAGVHHRALERRRRAGEGAST